MFGAAGEYTNTIEDMIPSSKVDIKDTDQFGEVCDFLNKYVEIIERQLVSLLGCLNHDSQCTSLASRFCLALAPCAAGPHYLAADAWQVLDRETRPQGTGEVHQKDSRWPGTSPDR